MYGTYGKKKIFTQEKKEEICKTRTVAELSCRNCQFCDCCSKEDKETHIQLVAERMMITA